MNLGKFLFTRSLNRIASACLAGWVIIAAASPLAAAPGALKRLSLTVSVKNRTATAEVPPGIRLVTLQRYDRLGGWRKVATQTARDGRVAFKLPKAGLATSWRALGREEIAVEVKPQRKFPAGFYRGKNDFTPTLSEQLGEIVAVPSLYAPLWQADLSVFNTSSNSTSVNAAALITAEPVEADIWQTDGTTVYFFNQLRGLQILNLSIPADPRLVATLRLPAVGEDLYLLPSSGASRSLVLLTRVTDGASPATRIQMVNFANGVVEITHQQDVPGVLADSRMVGDKLVLVTTERAESPFRWISKPKDSKTSVRQWQIVPGHAPVAAGEATLLGAQPVIAAGQDWLAVALTGSKGEAISEVSVFSLGEGGLASMTAAPVRTAGVVLDKFKLQWSNGVLTTISEKRRTLNSWSPPLTVLENFQVTAAATAAGNPLLGSLELARGETLHATRFAGNKAYIVTFRRTDPLWIVDLSDPAMPTVAGHLEVPGWSTFLEPIGDLLFSVGWESGTLAASLFDVADPAAPTLLRRINLGSRGTQSEVAWNEKALKILPAAGLVMIPLTIRRDDSWNPKPVLQLLDLDLVARDLRQRGVIEHEFNARRSAMVGNAVVSISQKALIAADITDRDLPKILAEVSLVWPVDHVLETGAHLLQIEAGDSYVGRATARISPADNTEAILAEVDLGDGKVQAATVREGKLFVLRDLGLNVLDSGAAETQRRIHLDVYDLSALPTLTLLGSCAAELDRSSHVSSAELLWPRPHRPAVVLSAQNSFRPFPVPIFAPSVMPTMTTGLTQSFALTGTGLINIMPFYWTPQEAPKLLVFDTTDATAPLAGLPVTIGTADTVANGVYQAADGLIVVGTSDWKNVAAQSVHVVEIGMTGEPVVRPGIDLPGTLFAVTELDRAGFLAFTRGTDAEGKPRLQASACDGFDAFEITGLEVAHSQVTATAGGRRLFLAADAGVARFRLDDGGAFLTESELPLAKKPTALSWLDGLLIGRNPQAIFAAEPQAAAAATWPIHAVDLRLNHVVRASDGDLLVPLGNYGAARLER